MTPREVRDRIRRQAKRARVELAPDLCAALERYFALLSKWNAKINLTSFTLDAGGSEEAVDRLLIEPIAAVRHLAPEASTLIDIGSGGGSPVIPLALAVPRLHSTLVESKTRKVVFLREALRELQIRRARVENARVEVMLSRPELHESLDVVTIRAVRVEPALLTSLQAFLKPGGQLWLFRGPAGSDFEAALPPTLNRVATHPLVDALRSRLIVLQKTDVGR